MAKPAHFCQGSRTWKCFFSKKWVALIGGLCALLLLGTCFPLLMGRKDGFKFSWLDSVVKRISNETILWGMGHALAQCGWGDRSLQAAFSMVAGLDLHDPRTFLGKGLPMFSLFDSEIDVASEDVDYGSLPIEEFPPEEVEREISKEMERNPGPIVSNPHPQQGLGKQVLIYHTHFWESYLPELQKTDPRGASHVHKNITRVGQYLAGQLEKIGVGAFTTYRTYGVRDAYDSSRRLVKGILMQYGDIPYLVDIHRDSQRRDKTTIECGSDTYARLLFIVGGDSKYYHQNIRLAEGLHRSINQVCKGLSRGVLVKRKSMVANGEYNQSMSPHSILVEVGGVDNNFREAYRSMDVLADVLRNHVQFTKVESYSGR
ncbi:stage II sporulation protein P [Pasteuria penetrans]|uniref:stage II sporulation protein P n=1 Tax=Pasteuria penetrans TaxID=86005 RepID=UPI0011EFF1A9|nr:stage II sporulation protein P [Pasteuria penetrans]